jgi:transcriptional regulator with XRE-family HTH domain
MIKTCHHINMTTWIFDKRKTLGLSQTEVAGELGVSRPTYAQIETGKRTPTAQQKAILARILETSIEILHNRSTAPNIISTELEVRSIPKESKDKFKQTLLYILNKVGSRPNVGQTALYKLLYFIDFDYYEKFEEQLIGATYIKNTYGPTPVSFAKLVREMEDEGQLVEVKSKHFGYDQIKYVAAKEADVSCLSGRELKHIDDEIKRLAHMTAKELSELSHTDTPWRVAGDKEILNYEHVFYRPVETSVREYEEL